MASAAMTQGPGKAWVGINGGETDDLTDTKGNVWHTFKDNYTAWPGWGGYTQVRHSSHTRAQSSPSPPKAVPSFLTLLDPLAPSSIHQGRALEAIHQHMGRHKGAAVLGRGEGAGVHVPLLAPLNDCRLLQLLPEDGIRCGHQHQVKRAGAHGPCVILHRPMDVLRKARPCEGPFGYFGEYVEEKRRNESNARLRRCYVGRV